MPWRPIPLSYAIAIYPFQPSSSSTELPLQIGDQLYIIEVGGKYETWCRGYLVQQPSFLSALTAKSRIASDARVFSGIFPRCCIEVREQLGHDDEHKFQAVAHGSIRPQAPVPMLKIGDESPTSIAEPLVDEISSCIREWYVSFLPNLVIERDYDRLDQVSDLLTRLDYARRELLNDVLTTQERLSVRSEAVWDLVKGNKLLGAEVVVRDPEQKGRLMTADDSAVELAKLQSVMSLLEAPPLAKQEIIRLHHCMLEVKSSNTVDTDNITISFALYQKAVDGTIAQLSETFVASAALDSKILFTDITSRDIHIDGRLFLVAKVSILEAPRKISTPSLDRSPSRTGTLTKTRDSLINRRRSNLGFGSKRLKERPDIAQNGRARVSKQETRQETLPDADDQSSADSSKKTGPPVTRIVGHAVYDIAGAIRDGREEVFDMEFWSPAENDDEEEEIGWPGLLPELLQTRHVHYVRCKKISHAKIQLKSFLATDAEVLIRMNPTSMHTITKSQRIGFSNAPTKRRSDIYLTLSQVLIKPNGAFSHPQHGAVPVKSTSMLNLQATMELRDSNGKRLDRCIYASANGPAVTALRTTAVGLNSLWDQTVCIRLPLEKVADAHLILSVADAPGFPFALAWMPLWDKHAFRRDGNHSLILHAYDKSTSTFSDAGQGMYLNLPWDHTTIKEKEVPIACLQIKTQLVSTDYSQDRTLASLLNWRALSSASLMDTLQKLVFVPEVEIVKQLNEVLNALFSVLEYKAGTFKFEDQLFNDLVFVLGIVHDRRFNLGPLVERYADEHFKAPLVAPSLVRSFTRLMQSVSDPQSARDLRALFKVGKQFMRLLMESYSRYNQIDDTGSVQNKHESFLGDMKAVFFGLQMMMRSETPALVGNKTLLTQNFHTWLPEMLIVYSKDDVITIAVDLIDAFHDSTGKLLLYRLLLILNYIGIDELWGDDKHWDILVENCIRWLQPLWPKENDVTNSWKDQVRLCSSIVAALLRRPTPSLYTFLPAIIRTYSNISAGPRTKQWSISLLFPNSYPFATIATEVPDLFDESLIELSVLVADIFKIKTVSTRVSVPGQEIEFISGALFLVNSILSQETHPITWLSLHISHHTAALHVLSYVAKELEVYHLPEPEEAESFDMGIWKSFFESVLSLVLSPELSLESFSEQKRRAVWKISGDVRQLGADLLRYTWCLLGWEATEDDLRRYHIEKLGGYQVQYVPSLVGPIIALCLSMHEGLRRVGVEILRTMIISEWGLSEDLSLIETEVIGALNMILRARDVSLSSLTGNEIVARKLFVGELLDSFGTIANQPDDALWSTLEDLVSTIEELIDLLSGVKENVDDDNDYRKSNGTHRGASGELPERSISRLEGKVYGDQALQMYKQLAEEYERNGDYGRLAKTHRAMARIHETRATSRLGHVPDGGGSPDENEAESS